MQGRNRVSFAECPNKCINGILYNPYSRVSQPCPYCEEKRKEELAKYESNTDEKSIYEILKIQPSLSGDLFSMEMLIPEVATKYLTKESLSEVEDTLSKMLSDITIGEYPDYSILFNFGKTCDASIFYVPFMTKAYRNGLKVAPLLDVLTLSELRINFEKFGNTLESSTEWGASLKDYLEADICIVTIDAGATPLGVGGVKGLMQLRALKGKPTYIFTNLWGKSIYEIHLKEPQYCCHVANLVEVIYQGISSDDTKSAPTLSSGIPSVGVSPNLANISGGSQVSSSQFSNMFGK